jgi:hypothetical protein
MTNYPSWPLIVIYLVLILGAFGAAGAIDLAEEERLSVRNYVAERLAKECP